MKVMMMNVTTAYNNFFRSLQIIKAALKKAPSVIPEDLEYKWRFINQFIPALYEHHIRELYANCIFCSKLVRDDKHNYCLKCSCGTYLHCAPVLPTIMFGSVPHSSAYCDKVMRPWYYKETCSKFSRLPKSKYFRNLYSPLSTLSIYNYESLEGLEKGLLSGKRPCHLCASLDYEIYRTCLNQEDFSVASPCTKIYSVMASFYRDKPSS